MLYGYTTMDVDYINTHNTQHLLTYVYTRCIGIYTQSTNTYIQRMCTTDAHCITYSVYTQHTSYAYAYIHTHNAYAIRAYIQCTAYNTYTYTNNEWIHDIHIHTMHTTHTHTYTRKPTKHT